MLSKSFRRSLPVLLFLGLLIVLPNASTAADISVFLKYDGLPEGCGNSQEDQYAGQIVVRSFGELLGHATDDSGLPIGKSQSRSIQIAKDMDRCSPAIFLDTVMERDIASLTISFVTSSGDQRLTFAKIDATDVQIVAMNLDTSAGGSNVAERLTFAINRQLSVTFRRQNPDGSLGPPVTTCWNFKQNSPC